MEKIVSETITEEIFRTMYLGMNFLEKSAIPPEYNFKSKKGTDNKGYPDFFKDMKEKDFLIIVECKAETKKHSNAEEEVKLYMSCTNAKHNSVGIAVSGQEIANLSVSMFVQLKGNKNIIKLNVSTLTSLENIEKLYKEIANKTNYSKLIKYSDELNTTFHNLFKINVSKRPFFFAGLLFSLEELSSFLSKYQHEEINFVNKDGKEETIDFNDVRLSDKDKVDFINSIIANQIELKFKGQLNNKFKATDIPAKFQFIKTEIKNLSFLEYVSFLKTFTGIFKEYKATSGYYDVIGTFYSEFLRYVQKAGGQDIVLTPDHIKDLMSDLINVSKNDVILDICAGSGGFGTVVLNKMLEKTRDDEKELKNKIKKESIISVEIDDDMYTLAYSNMILHGGGFKNLYKGNSLTNFEIEENEEIITFEEMIKRKQPNKSIMNPPYNDDAAPDFILRLCKLMYLSGNGTKQIIVIAPSSCLRKKIDITKKIFEIAKLKTVIDMNGGLFVSQNINVKTSLFIFEVGIEHSGETYFYDFKDDGFNYSKRKMEDLGNFENFKLELFKNIRRLEIIDNKSYLEEINQETFENTVYSPKKEFQIDNFDFIKSIINYSVFELQESLNEK